MAKIKKFGVGVIGLGFMGRTHLTGWHDAEKAGYPCEVVAVCDKDRKAPNSVGEGNLRFAFKETDLYDPARVQRYNTAAELIADDKVKIVSICTNTESHAELTLAALAAGKHVLCEKPVALDAPTVRKVAAAAAAAKTLCMPAMCMRFWPGWSLLKTIIDKNTYGKVLSASFQRLSSAPNWSTKFYRDPSRSGGALVDLHIHDADLVHYLFGAPESVTSTGSLDHITTLYHYKNGPPHVAAEGGWNHAPGFPFRMRFIVIFEKATLDFDLLRNEKLMISRDGKCVAMEPADPEHDADTGYGNEIRHFADCVASGRKGLLRATMNDALAVTELLACERDSLSTGKTKNLRLKIGRH